MLVMDRALMITPALFLMVCTTLFCLDLLLYNHYLLGIDAPISFFTQAMLVTIAGECNTNHNIQFAVSEHCILIVTSCLLSY